MFIKLLIRSFLVGALFGLIEGLFTLLQRSGLNAAERHFVLLLAFVIYGFASAVTGLLAILIYRWLYKDSPLHSTSLALSVAIGTMLALQMLAYLMRFRDPRLVWLLPPCIVTAITCSIILYRLLKRFTSLRRLVSWGAISLPLLIVAIAISTGKFTHGDPKAITSKPNILLISIDTLRRDHVGAYGDAYANTPVIDRLAKQGILFEDATTPVPLTGPAHISMLTGLYPSRHGVEQNGVRLAYGRETIADLLSANGYFTAAFISGWTLKDVATGLAGHFRYYNENFSLNPWFPDSFRDLALPALISAATITIFQTEPRLERNAYQTTASASKWLVKQGKSHSPFFLFIHYFDPHAPYQQPGKFDRQAPLEVNKEIVTDARRIESMKKLYRAEISNVDAALGRLMQVLQSEGLDRNTIIILTADHGESLTEHDVYFDHGDFLYDTCVRVPLIIRFPDLRQAGKRITKQTSLLDLTPTIAESVQVRPPENEGQSLLPIIEDRALPDRPAYGALRLSRREARFYVRAGGFKLIWNFDVRNRFTDQPASEELYDLRSDPGETKNLIGESREILTSLRAEMRRWVTARQSAHEPPSEEVQERLRSLGYF